MVCLLTRHFGPHPGRVIIDGQDIADVTQESLSQAIGEAGQMPSAFTARSATTLPMARRMPASRRSGKQPKRHGAAISSNAAKAGWERWWGSAA